MEPITQFVIWRVDSGYLIHGFNKFTYQTWYIIFSFWFFNFFIFFILLLFNIGLVEKYNSWFIF